MADEKLTKGSVQQLKDLSQQADSMLYGSDPKLSDENKAILQNIRKAIALTRKNISNYTGDNITEFYKSLEYDKEDRTNKNKAEQSKAKAKHSKDVVGNNALGLSQQILANESGRISLYENYDVLISYIPILGKAVDAYVDAILSPDNYTNTSVNFAYSGSEGNTSTEASVLGNLENLRENYNLDSKIVDIVRNALQYGDEFYAVLGLEKEFSTFLQEKNDRYILNEGLVTDALTESELTDIDELHEEFIAETEQKKKSKIEWAKEINQMINENIEFTTDSTTMIEENVMLNESFNMETIKTMDSEALSTNQKLSQMMMNSKNSTDSDDSGDKKDTELKINGSVLKHLDRNRIVKIYNDGVTYGYYYIEDASQAADKLSSSETLSGIFSHNFRSSKHMDVNTQNVKAKTKLITDVFVRKIAKKLNKEFLMNHQEFKNTIYNLLKMDYITKKKVKIVFLQPNEVFHFYPKLQSDGYGESMLKNSMFLGMIYVSTLITTLMMKLIRSPQKRVFYVETGGDEDYEGVINDFVKNLKTTDMKIVGKDINTVLNSIGAFHDVFIPKIDGNAPIEYDTMDGLDANLSDDFLEYLLTNLVDSTGVPPSFIQSSAEIDFSKEISMQNAKFVRTTSSLQKVLVNPMSGMVRTLYTNEYKYKDNHLNTVDINEIKVSLPKPISLMLSTINEQIQGVKDLTEYASSVYLGENNEDEELKKEFSMKVAREFFPSLDWNRLDKIFEESKTSSAKKKVETKLSTTSDDSSGDNDDSGDNTQF